MKDFLINNVIKNKKIIFVIIGIISIILAIVCSGEGTGYSELAKTYGGDAYTGIQQAAAQTANNVKAVGYIIRFGFSAILAVMGLLSIAYGITAEKKINYSNDIQSLAASIAQLEETVKTVSAPCADNVEDAPETADAIIE